MQKEYSCLLYFHIPRTGGTWLRQSITTCFVEKFDPHQVYFVNGSSEFGCAYGSYQDLCNLSPKERSRLRFVAGHMPVNVLNLMQDAFSVTVMRDPVERAISDYWYCYHEPMNPAHQYARNLSPVEFCRQGFGQAKNGHARYLSGSPHSGITLSDDALYQVAMNNLKRFSLVGHHSHLQALASTIEQTFGIHRMAMTGFSNAAERTRSVSTNEKESIRVENSIDYKLYDSKDFTWVGSR